MMHGYTREEFIGLQLITCIHPDSQYVFSESIQVFQSDGVFDLQTLGVRRGWLNILCRMARDDIHVSRTTMFAGYCP